MDAKDFKPGERVRFQSPLTYSLYVGTVMDQHRRNGDTVWPQLVKIAPDNSHLCEWIYPDSVMKLKPKPSRESYEASISLASHPLRPH